MADNTFMRTMLFDFYGEVLTEKQREYYDLHYNSDLSLYEIAEMSGVSRQAVWDIIRRAEQTLRELESKTGLVARAVKRRRAAEELEKLIQATPEAPERGRMLELLQEIKE